jgi:transcriptional regulator with XRE-family HTH domain
LYLTTPVKVRQEYDMSMDGDEMRALRVRKRWSQSQLGTLLKVTPQYVGMMERGAKDIQPHIETAVREALGDGADSDVYVPSGPEYRAAKDAVLRALSKEPSLSLNGFPYQHDEDPFDAARSEHESRARLFTDDSLAQVATAIAWIDSVKTIKTPTTGSYGAKHQAERWGRENGYASYVANGALLVGAIYRKIPMKRVARSPNALLALDTNPMPDARPGSFTAWLRAQTEAGGRLGDLARDVAEDRTFPINTSSGPRLRSYMRSQFACDGAMAALEDALRLWRSSRKQGKPFSPHHRQISASAGPRS